jgi:hypothetical protein
MGMVVQRAGSARNPGGLEAGNRGKEVNRPEAERAQSSCSVGLLSFTLRYIGGSEQRRTWSLQEAVL